MKKKLKKNGNENFGSHNDTKIGPWFLFPIRKPGFSCTLLLIRIQIFLIKDADKVQCPPGCECKSATKCQWSTNAINLLSGLQASNPLWKFHSSRIVKQICDKKNRHVCCCGPDEVSPDKCKSRIFFTALFFLTDFFTSYISFCCFYMFDWQIFIAYASSFIGPLIISFFGYIYVRKFEF